MVVVLVWSDNREWKWACVFFLFREVQCEAAGATVVVVATCFVSWCALTCTSGGIAALLLLFAVAAAVSIRQGRVGR